MSINSALDACTQWLQHSLRSLKTDHVEVRLSSAALALPRQKLLAALYERDLVAAQRICQEFDEIKTGAQSSVRDLILPSVYAVEREWLDNSRDYNDTLAAFWYLQKLLERPKLGPEHQPFARSSSVQGRTVFATAPGCEHNLGVLVVSDYFRSWGWPAMTLLEGRREVLVREVSSQPIDFLGLSVGHDAGLEGLPELLQELRAFSCNSAMRILVGGNIFDMPVDAYAWIGADCLVTTPQDALQYCASIAHHRTH